MRVQRHVWLLLAAGLLFFVQPVYAGPCDDMNAEAKAALASAREASSKRDYDRAAELYEEAGKYFEEVANMTGCSCSTIPQSAPGNAKMCRDAAAQARLGAQYRVANEKYDEGTAYAKKMQWDEAIAAFQEAAQMWDSVGAATQSELGKTALKSANVARDAAQMALDRKNNDNAWQMVIGK